MAFDLKLATPAASIGASGFLFGAGSQSDADPQIYEIAAITARVLAGFSANGLALGAMTYAQMRAALDLEAGTDFLSPSAIAAAYQPLSAVLTTYAGISPSANVQSLLGAASYAAMRALLDLEAGTDFYSKSSADSTFAALANLASQSNGAGAALIGIEDTGSYFSGATVEAALAYLGASLAALDQAVILKGTWDASSGSFPGAGSAQAGWSYIVSVGGTVDGQVFVANDRIVATADNASTSTYASNWHKLDYTDQVLSVAGKTGAVTLAASDLADASANAVSLITSANYAAMRALLDLEAGTDFLSPSAIAAAYQPLATALTSWASVTRASGFDTFAATPSSANLRALLTDESGSAALYFQGGDLGTPSAGVGTNLTGIPASALVASTSQAVGFGSIELGHASDTTLARLAAGVVGVEGAALAFRDITPTTLTGGTEVAALAHGGGIVEMNNGSANTYQIPTNATVAFPIGTIINVIQYGAGTTSIEAVSGVTLNGVADGIAAISARYAGVSLVKRGTNEWTMQGAHGTVA